MSYQGPVKSALKPSRKVDTRTNRSYQTERSPETQRPTVYHSRFRPREYTFVEKTALQIPEREQVPVSRVPSA
jgi:hypothetical protein